MRKGQQKILDKASLWGESALNVLKDESWTIKELDSLYHILLNHCNENFSSETVEKLRKLIFYFNCPQYYFYNKGLSLIQFLDFYEILSEKFDSTKALGLVYLYSVWNQYQEEPVCSFEDVEKLYSSVDAADYCWTLCWRYDGYFEKHLYTKDNLDSIIRAEKLRDRYFEANRMEPASLLLLENTFSDDELEKISHDKTDSSSMLHRCYMSLFKEHFPDTYHACVKCYKSDVNTDKQCLYAYLLSGFVIMESDKMEQMYKIFGGIEPAEGLSFHLPGYPRFMKMSFSLTGFSFEFAIGYQYIGSYDLKAASDNSGQKLMPRIVAQRYKNTHTQKYLILYENNAIYKQTLKGKWIPCSYKDFLLLHSSNILDVVFKEYIDSQIEKGCYIWKDIKENDYYQSVYLPPFKVEEINNNTSFDMMMRKKYKNADFVNWNKCDIQWCYASIQMLPKVNNQSKILLLSLKYSHEYGDIHVYRRYENVNKSNWTQFLLDRLDSYAKQRGSKDDTPEVQRRFTLQIIKDYFRLCSILHRKINLCFLSGQKIKEVHDELLVEQRKDHTPSIKIPKNTKFAELDKLLPDNFEKITSKKRIIQEGVWQHHCVASYASAINKDYCAIYSFVYDDKRYTIEFSKRKNNYYIEQLYGICNEEASNEVWNYVRSFLKNTAN